MRGNKATISHLLGENESFSISKSIRNAKITPRSTEGMIGVALHDEYNTIVFFDTQEEADRVLPKYKSKIATYGTPAQFAEASEKKLMSQELKETNHESPLHQL